MGARVGGQAGGWMGVRVGCVAVCQDDDDITCIGGATMRALGVKKEPEEEEEQQQLGGRRGGEGLSEALWWVDAWARWVGGG